MEKKQIIPEQSISKNKSEGVDKISQQQLAKTPQSSSRISKKTMDLKKLQSMNLNSNIGQFKAFVVGFSGGDCAGKKQMLGYLFSQRGDDWYMRDSSHQFVAILHQGYFRQSIQLKYSSQGTNWDNFFKAAYNLIIGNPVIIEVKNKTITIKPAKLLIIQGSHIFMETPKIKPLFDLINTKIFIDSDSDVRLSRRVYKDTQDDGMDLDASIQNYINNIKPSYQKQIEPTKVKSDIILPHFGGGYDDHRKQNRRQYDTNIKNAGALIMAHVRQQMNRYQAEELEFGEQQNI